jgi:hypothetical protein
VIHTIRPAPCFQPLSSYNELISKHVICQEPVIFEGDGILPELLVQRDLHQLKSLFLFNAKERLFATDIQRRRGTYTGEDADKQAEFAFQFGLELEKQAEFHHFPVVKTTPMETLYTRVLAVLES